ncbi:MAG: energy transducer TonB [Pseudobdellovibrionaceae bacterium]
MATFITRKNRTPVETSTSQGLGTAILFHGLVVLIFTVKFIFFPESALILESAIRVDIVGLPDKISDIPLTPPAPAQTAAAPPKIETPPPAATPAVAPPKMPDKTKMDDAINLDKTKSKQNEALDRLKKLNAIDQIKKSLENESRNSAKAAAPVKGNVISAGSSLTGINKLQHDQYRGLLNEHVKQNWTAPEWLSNKKLKTQVLAKFDQAGILLEKKILLSSGNAEFDTLAMTALERSVPLPEPPEKFVDVVKYNGVVIEFGGD